MMLTAQFLGLIAVIFSIMGLAVLVLSLALTGPDWVTAAAVSLSFINAGVLASLSGAPAASSMLPYALLLMPAGYQILVKRAPIVWGWPMTFMLAFVVIAMASTVLSTRPGDSFATLIEWLLEGVVFLFAMTNSIRSVAALRRCVQGMVIGGAVVGIAVAYQHQQGDYFNTYFGLAQVSDPYDITSSAQSVLADGEELGQFRSAGMIGEPNFFAMLMTALTPWAAYLAFTSRTVVYRLGWAAAGLFISYAVFVSYSRGALLAAGAVLVLLALWGIMPRRSLLYLSVAAGLAVMAVPTLAERLATLGSVVTSGGGAEASSAGRLSEVGAAWEVFASHPVLGVGPGQFPLYYQRYAGHFGGGVHSGDGARNAHNIVMGLAADLGLVGLFGFGLLVGAVVVGLVRTRRSPRFRAPATAALVSVSLYLGCSAFLHLAFARYLWLYLALSAAVISIASREVQLTSQRQTRRFEDVRPR